MYTGQVLGGPLSSPPALMCSAAVAAALAWAAAVVVGVVASDRGDGRRADVLETRRRARLRTASALYRWLEPVVDNWAGRVSARRPNLVRRVARQLAAMPDEPPWGANEWVAVQRMSAIGWATALGVATTVLAAGIAPSPAIAVGPLAYLAAMRRALDRLDERAGAVRAEIGRSLPFALDLWTLMFRAGATFRPSVETIARNFPLSSFSSHLDRLGRDMDRGLPRDQALSAFAARLGMEEVDALVFAVNQGEALGTPLGQILAMQAQQLRDRQSNAIERAAERIKIKFNGPGVVAMLASILTMLAPFLASIFDLLPAGR